MALIEMSFQGQQEICLACTVLRGQPEAPTSKCRQRHHAIISQTFWEEMQQGWGINRTRTVRGR